MCTINEVKIGAMTGGEMTENRKAWLWVGLEKNKGDLQD